MPRPQHRCVAVLGADGTGKTELAQALAEALRLAGRRVDVVVADTAPLLAAACSDLQLGNHALHRLALQHQACYSHTLLMGLDLPWVADGLHGPSQTGRAQLDARLRSALAQAGITFQVVYGQGGQRLQNALSAIGAGFGSPPQPAGRQEAGAGRWAWACDKCSDPACEHRLFTSLTAR